MTRRPKTAAAIDVGHRRVTLSLVAREADGLRLVRTASCQIAGDADAATLSRAIRQLRRQARIPPMTASLGLSVSPIVLQTFDMPGHMPANIREFIRNELRQYVAFSGRSIVCDFCMADSGEDSQKRLLAAAGERERVAALLQACASAGLDIVAVEPSILAYARAACGHGRAAMSAKQALVVEVGAQQLTACLFRKGALDDVRTRSLLPQGRLSQDTDEWLADEIETMVRHYDIQPVEGGDREVTIVIRDDAPVTSDVEQCLKARVGMQVRVVGGSGRSDGGSALADGPAPRPDDTGVSIGLAMRAMDPDANARAINLLPEEVMQARRLTRHVLTAVTAAAVIFLGMLVALQFVSRSADRTRREIERTRVTRGLHAMPHLTDEARSIDVQIASVGRQLTEIRNVLNDNKRVDWPRTLEAVADSAPEGACVTHIWTPDAGRLSVKGLAASCNAAQVFAQSLGERTPFDWVVLAGMDRSPGGDSLIHYEIDSQMSSRP